MASFTAAGTAYATHGEPMVPFFIFYSMFGFQRVGDLIWAFGDVRGRGFLLRRHRRPHHAQRRGPPARRTATACCWRRPCPTWPPTTPPSPTSWRVIVEDGMRRMYGDEPEDVFYYLTLYNENYAMPAMPEGAEEGSVRGLYRFAAAPEGPVAAGDDPVQRHGPGRGPGGPASCWPTTTTWPPSCGAPRRTRRCGRTPWRPSAGTGCTPPRRPARPTSPRPCRRPRARSWPSPTS